MLKCDNETKSSLGNAEGNDRYVSVKVSLNDNNLK